MSWSAFLSKQVKKKKLEFRKKKTRIVIRSIKVGGDAFLKHGIASALHLLQMLILIKHRAVSSLLTYTEKFEKDIVRIF